MYWFPHCRMYLQTNCGTETDSVRGRKTVFREAVFSFNRVQKKTVHRCASVYSMNIYSIVYSTSLIPHMFATEYVLKRQVLPWSFRLTKPAKPGLGSGPSEFRVTELLRRPGAAGWSAVARVARKPSFALPSSAGGGRRSLR